MADLRNYTTGDYIRTATADETVQSITVAECDGGAGVIQVDGIACYVED